MNNESDYNKQIQSQNEKQRRVYEKELQRKFEQYKKESQRIEKYNQKVLNSREKAIYASIKEKEKYNKKIDRYNKKMYPLYQIGHIPDLGH